MTQLRTIAGLRWESHDPSFYQLAGYPQVEIAYLGHSGTGADWFLFLEERGAITSRPFASKEAAAGMVAQAFNVPGAG